MWKSYTLALAGQPCLHGYDACMVDKANGALRRNCREKHGKPSFSPFRVFLFSQNSSVRYWGLILWHLWIGRARHPGPGLHSRHFGLEVFNVGRWLTHGDLALEAGVDFLAVVEHRLIPTRVRSEWARLGRKDLASVWAPACQDSSHVGNAGVGAVSMKGAPLALPYFATAKFKRVRCMLPLGFGRFMHLVVLYGYQGPGTDAEQLALTEQLFDAEGELSVVARGQPCMLVGDFNVEPTKIPCLAKGISAVLWVDFEEAWALAAGLQPAPTGKRDWSSACGHRRDFMVRCPLAAAVLSCRVQADRWVAPHLSVQTLFDCCRWDCRVTQPVQRTPLRPASWLPAVDKNRGSKSVDVQRVWEIHDDRLQLMSRQEAMQLDESLDAGDVSRAWRVWSGAAEVALDDAFRFSGGPVTTRGP